MPRTRRSCRRRSKRLPGPERPDFGVTLGKAGKDEVLVEAAFAGEPDAVDFFLAGYDGYQFGTPVAARTGRASCCFPCRSWSGRTRMPAEGALHYTLVTAAGAVPATLPYPPAP